MRSWSPPNNNTGISSKIWGSSYHRKVSILIPHVVPWHTLYDATLLSPFKLSPTLDPHSVQPPLKFSTCTADITSGVYSILASNSQCRVIQAMYLTRIYLVTSAISTGQAIPQPSSTSDVRRESYMLMQYFDPSCLSKHRSVSCTSTWMAFMKRQAYS